MGTGGQYLLYAYQQSGYGATRLTTGDVFTFDLTSVSSLNGYRIREQPVALEAGHPMAYGMNARGDLNGTWPTTPHLRHVTLRDSVVLNTAAVAQYACRESDVDTYLPREDVTVVVSPVGTVAPEVTWQASVMDIDTIRIRECAMTATASLYAGATMTYNIHIIGPPED